MKASGLKKSIKPASDGKICRCFRDSARKMYGLSFRDYDLPFYAKIPGIKSIIEKDFNDGLRAMDLNQELVGINKNSPVSEPTLAKMEWVITNDTMPPAKFTAVHWGSKVTAEDKKNHSELG